MVFNKQIIHVPSSSVLAMTIHWHVLFLLFILVIMCILFDRVEVNPRESGVYRDPHVRSSIRHTFGFRIIIKVPLNQIFSHIAVYLEIQVKFDYSVFHIYRSWVMALILLENRDLLCFRMIFKVWLNQIFSNKL